MLSEDRTNGARADLSPRWPQCSRAVPRRRAAAAQRTSRAAGQDDPQRLNNPRMMRQGPRTNVRTVLERLC